MFTEILNIKGTNDVAFQEYTDGLRFKIMIYLYLGQRHR